MSLEVDAASAHGHEGDVLLAELLVDDLHHRGQHEEVRRQVEALAAAGELLGELSGRLAERRELPRQGLQKLDSRVYGPAATIGKTHTCDLVGLARLTHRRAARVA